MDKDNEYVKIDDDSTEIIEIEDDIELNEKQEEKSSEKDEYEDIDKLLESKSVDTELEKASEELLKDEQKEEKLEELNQNLDDSLNDKIIDNNDEKVSEEKKELNEVENLENKPEEIENYIKNNNIQNSELAKKIVNKLENERDIREEKEKHNKNKKNIRFMLGIIIELLIIIVILYSRNYRNVFSTKSSEEKIIKELTCTNTTQNDEQDYSLTENNIYYFDKNDKVVKTQNSLIYIFNNKASYDNYKKSIISNSLNFLGVEQKDIFDDINYVYENKIIYNYKELKANKEVVFKNNMFTFKLPNSNNNTTIEVDSYNNVLQKNKNAGIICE